MSNRNLSWRHLKALNELYVKRQTRAKIADNGFISNYLIGQKKVLRYKSGNANILQADYGFDSFYEKSLKAEFTEFEAFLLNSGLEDDARKQYNEDDIATLIFIADHKDDLLKNLSTTRTFSSQIFKGKGSKYLEKRPALKNAVCTLLGIDDFPDKDPKNLQWRLVVDCINPEVIVLCENIAPLKSPWKARELNLELWYVGGNNIGIIDHISEEKLAKPLYYSCDWDYDGLAIYSRIKEKLLQKSATITILEPPDADNALTVNSPHHNSQWHHDKLFSGLKEDDFSIFGKSLITELIKKDEWIEEESLDLNELLRINNLQLSSDIN